MSAIDRGFESLSLSDSLRDALRRRVRELTGIALIALAMLLVAALASWSTQDPSLSHATNAPVRNLLGFGGAIVADLMMQLFGIASVAVGGADCGLGLAPGEPSRAAPRAAAIAHLGGRHRAHRELRRLPAAHRGLAAPRRSRRRHRRRVAALRGVGRRQ